MCLLPVDGTSQGLIEGNWFGVAQLAPYARRVHNDVLGCIDAHCQRLLKAALGSKHNAALPAYRLSNLLYPVHQGKRLFLANVVNTTTGTLVGDGERNGSSDVLDIATRPAPACLGLVEQYDGAVVVHSLEIGKEPVLFVSGT